MRRNYFLVFLMLFLVSCGGTEATPVSAPKQAITLALSYIPDIQFAPYYVAQAKGYFANEGLEVTFRYGTINDLMTTVGQGSLQFALASGDEVLQARAGGIPVTYLATQYQKYPTALVSLKDKNIVRPADLKGKTIGIPGQFGATYVGLKAILAAGNLTEGDVKIQTIGFQQREAIIEGKVDAAMVYSMNEPIQLQKAGLMINTIEVSSFVNLASIGIITSESLIKSNPVLVEKMVRAVTSGLRDTIADPKSAFESSVKVVPELKSADAVLQQTLLDETVKFMVSDLVKGQPIGYSKPEVWQESQKFLLSNNLLIKQVDASSAYTNNLDRKSVV